MPHVHCKKNSMRNRRKQRPLLEVGKNYKGVVCFYDPDKQSGRIRPTNGAADIRFFTEGIPLDRVKCVGEGCTVYFVPQQRGVVRRKKYTAPKLVALIQSSRPK